MSKLVPRRKAVATSLALSLASLAALALPATGAAAGEDALLSFSPAPVGFAKTTVGAESQPQAVDVHNVSGAAVAIDSVGFSGADAAPEQTVGLSGEAVPAQLAFTPGSYDFGIQRVNRGEGLANFQLANVGEAPTQLGGLGIGGPDRNNFWANGGNCSGGSWLQPGESCNVQVGFNPWDTVAYEAELQAYVNGATFAAPLTGFGGRAVVETSPNPVDFGSVPVGSVGPITPIVLSNNGNIATAFFIAVIAGGSVSSFQLIDEDCTAAPLEAGASCTAYVRFAPQVTGSRTSRLALFGDDDGGAMVILSGEGLAAEAPAGTGTTGTGMTVAAASSAAAPTASGRVRGKHRRFGRNTSLTAGRAHCLALCQQGKALRKRIPVVGG